MRWHTKGDNLVLGAILVKLWRSVAAVAVKDKQAVGSCCTRLRVSVKVLSPLKAKLISCPAVVANSDYVVCR